MLSSKIPRKNDLYMLVYTIGLKSQNLFHFNQSFQYAAHISLHYKYFTKTIFNLYSDSQNSSKIFVLFSLVHILQYFSHGTILPSPWTPENHAKHVTFSPHPPSTTCKSYVVFDSYQIYCSSLARSVIACKFQVSIILCPSAHIHRVVFDFIRQL